MRSSLWLTTLLLAAVTAEPQSMDPYARSEDNYDWVLDETPRGEVERLLQQYKQNQDLLRMLGSRYYQVVYPIQVRRHEITGVSTREIDNQYRGFGGRGVNMDGSGGQPGTHYRKTSLLIKAFQHKFRLDMELNTRLIAPNIRMKEFLKEEAVSMSQQDVEHCYYHGTVKDFSGGEYMPGSMAALQTCNGVSGIVHLGNETFVIHPFYGGDPSSKHPHVIYEYSDKSPQGCAVTKPRSDNLGRKRKRREGESPSSDGDADPATPTAQASSKEKKPDAAKASSSSSAPAGGGGSSKSLRATFDDLIGLGKSLKGKRDVRAQPKYIEVALVLDKAMFDLRPDSSRKDVIRDAIQVANIADLYFRNSLDTRLSIVYIETWQEQNQQAGLHRIRTISRAMIDFNDYVSRKLYQVAKDTTQLLTGQRFENGRSTIATVGTICAQKAVGISVDIDIFEPHILAANLAHAIGHNLGFRHDNEDANMGDCRCQDWHGCIMRASVIGDEGIQPYKFSGCTAKHFQNWIRDGLARCLLNLPNGPEGFDTCGNGIIDEGEQCDCGSQEECTRVDPCCDPVTCRFKMEAQCSSGPCCENCKLLPKNYPCRPAQDDECDLPEVCNGYTSECPADIFVQNTVPCNKGNGYCFNGRCPNMNEQCQYLWGRKSGRSDQSCFHQFNTGGTVQGNCGKNFYAGGFKPCERENVECGTLHCHGGSNKPIIYSDTYSSHTNKGPSGQDIQCKVASAPLDEFGTTDIGMVQDGTKCGQEMICLNQSCISFMHMKPYTRCHVNSQNLECSGNGICSNINTCVCDPGFTGQDCSKMVPTLPPFTPPTPNPGLLPTPGGNSGGSTPSNTYIPAPGRVTPPSKPFEIAVQHDKQNTVFLVIMLILGVASIFVCFAVVAICYSPATQGITEGCVRLEQSEFQPAARRFKESDSDTIIMVIFLVAGVGGVFILFALMALCYRSIVVYRNLTLCVRRKSALPKYEPPYMKRRVLKGSYPNSPHPSQHITPDHTFDDGSKLSLGGFPITGAPQGPASAPGTYREHGLQQMKRMANHGSANLHSMGSSSMLADPSFQTAAEKQGGILKKPPYGGLPPMAGALDAHEKEKWMEENAERLSRLDRMDRISTSSQNQLAGGSIPHDARSLSEVERTLKNLNGYQEGLLEALRSAAAHASHRGSNASSGTLGGPPPFHHRSSTASLADEQQLRKQLAESYLHQQQQPDYGAAASRDLVAAMAATLKRSSREKLDSTPSIPPVPPGSGGQVSSSGGGDHDGAAGGPGPIRIRNLEDLIRQLEHSSRHMSPSGSEDIRESEAERHFSHLLRTLNPDLHRDAPPAFAPLTGLHYPHHTSSSSHGHAKQHQQQRPRDDSDDHHHHHHQQQQQHHGRSGSRRASTGAGSPASTQNSASSSLRMRASRRSGSVRATSAMNYHPSAGNPGGASGSSGAGGGDPYGGVDTLSPGDPGGLTPGSTFDASEVDSEDFLRQQLMRSTSDEAVHSKSEDMDDEPDSIRSPFYKSRGQTRFPLSPNSPPSEEDSSYQGSIPGSGPSDRSYNGTGGAGGPVSGPSGPSGSAGPTPGAGKGFSSKGQRGSTFSYNH